MLLTFEITLTFLFSLVSMQACLILVIFAVVLVVVIVVLAT